MEPKAFLNLSFLNSLNLFKLKIMVFYMLGLCEPVDDAECVAMNADVTTDNFECPEKIEKGKCLCLTLPI